jgi:hypothetical protein
MKSSGAAGKGVKAMSSRFLFLGGRKFQYGHAGAREVDRDQTGNNRYSGRGFALP